MKLLKNIVLKFMMKKINFAVLNFPGSNCERDCFHVLTKILKQKCKYIWHDSSSISGVDCIVVPGGFSYGDYLRTGSIASQSKIAKKLKQFSVNGGSIIGICNGFQILTELKLLPGTLLRNKSLRFICKDVNLKVNNDSRFSNLYENNEIIKIPIAHAEGNFYADKITINKMKKNNQIIFSYSDSNGDLNSNINPNGSILNIAGITNKSKNVIGMMPHPERASEKIFGNTDGLKLFKSVINFYSN